MIPANRSYESIRCATRRDHLLPVIGTPLRKATASYRDSGRSWQHSLASAVIVFAFFGMLVCAWGMA